MRIYHVDSNIVLHYSGRSDSRLAPGQWETPLQSNTVSHWLGANLDSALLRYKVNMISLTTPPRGNAFRILWGIPIIKVSVTKIFLSFFIVTLKTAEQTIELPVICHAMTIIWLHCSENVRCWNRNISGKHGQYRCCWSPGSLQSQAISNYVIEYSGWMDPSL